jgi:hypothetical protein
MRASWSGTKGDYSTNIFQNSVCACAQTTGAAAGSRRLRATLTAAPVLFAQTVVTAAKYVLVLVSVNSGAEVLTVLPPGT